MTTNNPTNMAAGKPRPRKPPLRIASLLPSTTDICISLRLERHVVGVTHECDFLPDHPLYLSSADPLLAAADDVDDDDDDDCGGGGGATRRIGRPLTLTVSHIDPSAQSQNEIDIAVKSSLESGISLYELDEDALSSARPTLVLTQSLCDVCAVSRAEVDEGVSRLCSRECRVLSLEPETLVEVVETFVAVAEACGVRERGLELVGRFWEDAERILRAVAATANDPSGSVGRRRRRRPRVLFLEWLDPPYDAGHWLPDMIERSGCDSALPPPSPPPSPAEGGKVDDGNNNKWACKKSVQLTWERIYDSDPDVVVVGCCGFDLRRNVEDALAARRLLRPLRAFEDGRIYATDGNLYFARPGPALREGMAILARCAHDDDSGDDDEGRAGAAVVEALESLPFLPREGEGWSKVIFPPDEEEARKEKEGRVVARRCDGILPDVEDLISNGGGDDVGYSRLHEEACREGRDAYVDPSSGYRVFTRHAHEKRGRCCGSGCRHCPYDHANVRDKAGRIQQPAFLYDGDDVGGDPSGGGGDDRDAGTTATTSFFAPLSAIAPGSHVKVLFFSGGKDSFLAIRNLAREWARRDATPSSPPSTSSPPFHLVLLTTFDAESRTVAHQEVPIDDVVRQARHLGIPLLGVPLRRGSGETYVSRIEGGLAALRKRVLTEAERLTLVFGDLHLDHIREWREREFAHRYRLEYPLWKVPYDDLLADLEESGISVKLTAVTVEGFLKPGMRFTRELCGDVARSNMDGFGEEGEFHSIAEVWTVRRAQALGLKPKDTNKKREPALFAASPPKLGDPSGKDLDGN
jgi:ABC-type Fe3+-hydroxamate transport system substrate-binding protein/diphthamide synthase (EF-2-diphthine--ammonia ligase)